jgi:hypothetical protein
MRDGNGIESENNQKTITYNQISFDTEFANTKNLTESVLVEER